MEIKANAKINIGLDVLERRADGYHSLRTVMAQLDWADTLRIERARTDSLRCSMPALSVGEDNLIFRALRALEAHCGRRLPIRVCLEKEIPIGGGLAGGSTNAAATLRAVNELYALELSEEELRAVGVRVGADVPFCLMGGTALAEGIGESLTPIRNGLTGYLLMLCPDFSISTAAAYRHIRLEQGGRVDFDAVVKAVGRGEAAALKTCAGNLMEVHLFEEYPELNRWKEMLYEAGADFAAMSGSGSVLYGIFEGASQVQSAAEYFSVREARLSVRVTRLKKEGIL